MAKVIIIDDSELVLDDIKEVLKGKSYDFFEAKNGQEGLELIRNNQDCKLIITDLNMPHMNGLEMIEALYNEKIAIEVPKFILTTQFMTDKKNNKFMGANGRKYHIKAWFIKPINEENKEHFIESVERFLSGEE